MVFSGNVSKSQGLGVLVVRSKNPDGYQPMTWKAPEQGGLPGCAGKREREAIVGPAGSNFWRLLLGPGEVGRGGACGYAPEQGGLEQARDPYPPEAALPGSGYRVFKFEARASFYAALRGPHLKTPLRVVIHSSFSAGSMPGWPE